MAKQPLTIKRAYVRYYRDNGQTTAYVEWSDGSRTEGNSEPCACCGRFSFFGTHMSALLERAERDGLTIERERW